MKRIRAMPRRRLYTIADQGVSSLTNLALAVMVAHSVSASGYGVYAIATSIYWLGLGGQRAGLAEPLLILRADFLGDEISPDRRVLGLSFIAGSVIGVALLPFFLDAHLRPLAFLGLVFPALLWQDTVRYVCFARGRPGSALLADLIWLFAEVVGGAVIIAAHAQSIDSWIVVWGLSSVVSAVAVAYLRGLRPRARGNLAWARKIRTTAMQMLGDFLITSGGQQLTVFGLPIVSSLAVLGALKAAQVAAGPLQVTVTSASVLVIPAVAAASREGRYYDAARHSAKVSSVIFGFGCLYALVLTVLPHAWGADVFGGSWSQGSRIAGLIGFQWALIGVLNGAVIVLRGTRNTRTSLVVRLWITPLMVATPLAGAAVGGVPGVGIACVASSAFASLVWWRVTYGAIGANVRRDAAAPVPAAGL